MRKILFVLLVLGLMIGCSSKEAIDEVSQEATQPQEEVVAEETKAIKPETVAVAEDKPVAAVKPEIKKEDVKTLPAVKEKDAPKIEEPKKETAVSLSDSINVIYMTRPGDYLTKIALNEYGRASVWRMIWNWNYEKIGENPNRIYPYQEYDLKKPRELAKPVKYDLYDYVVNEGESLWSIANKEYGNNYSWVVILRDNFDLLGNNYDVLEPGMVLKLRTRLY